MPLDPHSLSPSAKWLGYSGLLPQLFLVVYAAMGAENLWVGQAMGFGYAALIFSFLGGAYWGVALMQPQSPTWIYAGAVVPSLIAFGTFVPWIWGLGWPVPSLIILGTGLLVSPIIDRAIARRVRFPIGWIKLRLQLSTGLGLLTLALCIV
jgi:hypothetical protein